jgi:hypothetical protein
MSTPNAPSVANWSYATCALNSCRARVLADEYDEHMVEHYDHLELIDAAKAYIELRNAIIERLNPRDDDVAEPAIMLSAIFDAADALEASGCRCPVDVEEVGPCDRCQALGRVNDVVVSR